MAKFCTRCGRPLNDGEICSCANNSQNVQQGVAYQNAQQPYQQAQQVNYPNQGGNFYQNAPNPYQNGMNQNPYQGGAQPQQHNPNVNYQQPYGAYNQNNTNRSRGTSFSWEAVKNHMGIGDPEMNKTDAYEKGKKIVPDCVKPSEGETPIKQYEIATFRTRLAFFNIAKAVGKIQLTSKRMIFRAPGKTILGRTTFQQEFNVNEIAGVETRRTQVLNIFDLAIGAIVMGIGVGVTTALTTMIANSSQGFAVFMCFLFAIAGCVPFAMLHKRWLVKILCLGAGYGPAMIVGKMIAHANRGYGYYSSGNDVLEFFGNFASIIAWIPLILAIICIIINSIIPSLSIIIKSKNARDAVVVKHRKLGYAEIIPLDDAEKCFREINAIINDIQTNGDACADKWK